MTKLLLCNRQSPGDVLMLTAAVRDLQRSQPGRYSVDVETSCAELWENNPHLTPLDRKDPTVRVVECQYPLIHRSNQLPRHFVEGFSHHLGQVLGCAVATTEFKGDIHLSEEEKARRPLVSEIVGVDLPYWLIVSGGKYDCTIKWWHFRRHQRVVDRFRDRILFVQVGERGHYHPSLHGVLDLRGRTTLRELILLARHAQGMVCPVTFLMHLAAAVEPPPNAPGSRACVVIAGGREPPHWEAYPTHQFIHTIGALGCCQNNGCWRSRTVPLGDGDEKDDPDRLCVDVSDGMPRCMRMITAEEVCRRVRWYFQGRLRRYLTSAEAAAAAPHLTRSLRDQLLA